jgi:hypothetical protein
MYFIKVQLTVIPQHFPNGNILDLLVYRLCTEEIEPPYFKVNLIQSYFVKIFPLNFTVDISPAK